MKVRFAVFLVRLWAFVVTVGAAALDAGGAKCIMNRLSSLTTCLLNTCASSLANPDLPRPTHKSPAEQRNTPSAGLVIWMESTAVVPDGARKSSRAAHENWEIVNSEFWRIGSARIVMMRWVVYFVEYEPRRDGSLPRPSESKSSGGLESDMVNDLVVFGD